MTTARADIATLHDEHQEWLTEITFWHNELVYYDRVLLRILGETKNPDEVSKIEVFKSRLDNLQDEFTKMREMILAHETVLNQGGLAETQAGSHTELRSKINQFQKSFRQLKGDFYAFVEKNCYW